MKIFITIALLLILADLEAQQISARVSGPVRDVFPRGTLIRSGNFLVGFDAKYEDPAVTRPGWKGKIVQLGAVIYDTSMNLLKSIPITRAPDVAGSFLKDIRIVNRVPYIIYHTVTGNDGIGNIMAVPVDLIGQTTGAPLLIADIVNSSYKLKMNVALNERFRYLLVSSFSGKRQLLFMWHGGSDCFISVLDENMRVLWSRSAVFDRKEKASIRSASIDDQGTVYISFATNIREERAAGTNLRLAIINKSGRESDQVISFPDAASMSPKLIASRTDADIIHIAGAYLNKAGEATEGMAMADFSVSRKSTTGFKRIPFPDSMITQLNKMGWIRSKRSAAGYGLSKFFDAGYYEKDDGGVVAVTQLQITNMSEGRISQNVGPLIYTDLGDSNRQTGFIPKGYSSVSFGDAAFCQSYALNNMIVLFYNDLNDDNDIRPGSSDRPELVVSFIGSDNIVRRAVVTDLAREKYVSLPAQSIRMSSNKWIVPLVKVDESGAVDGWQRWVEVEVY